MPERHHRIRHNPGRFSDRPVRSLCRSSQEHPLMLTPKPT